MLKAEIGGQRKEKSEGRIARCGVSSRRGVTCWKQGGSGSSDKFCPPIQGESEKRLKVKCSKPAAATA
jgi:hypothetical protein